MSPRWERCTGSVMARSKRERSREVFGGERENGRKKERVGPITVINWDPHEFSPNLNLDWIKKQVKD